MANQAGVKMAGLKLPTKMTETPSISGSYRILRCSPTPLQDRFMV